jgi:D-amino peptidase
VKIIIITDLEGCAGILDDEWIFPKGKHYLQGKRLLTDEVNAAIDGLYAGGAAAVSVVDGHGCGGLIPELLDKRASLLRGVNRWPFGMDDSFDGLAFVGQHAKSGTPYAHLAHTESFAYLDVSINNISVGEYGMLALCAMELGVPSILACGDKALTEEAQILTPGVITASLKNGLSPEKFDNLSSEEYAKATFRAEHLSPHEACVMVRDAAYRAILKLKKTPEDFHYPQLSPPYTRVCRFRHGYGREPYQTENSHSDSIINLLNLSKTECGT